MTGLSPQRRMQCAAIARVIVGACLGVSVAACPVLSQVTAGSEALALPDIELRVQTSREGTRAFSDMMKAQIGDAIKASGVKGAVGSCKPLSPELNATIGDRYNIEIMRTALRLRNQDNAPDGWEMANLELFLKQLNAGGDAKTMEAFDVTTTKEGQRLFRYMKPIMTTELCLSCHGPAIAPEVKLEIARNYSEDKATGFNIGEMRGAYSVVQELD